MVRLIAIFVLILLAYLLLRYRTNEKVQKGIVVAVLGIFAVYTVVLVVSELIE